MAGDLAAGAPGFSPVADGSLARGAPSGVAGFATPDADGSFTREVAAGATLGATGLATLVAGAATGVGSGFASSGAGGFGSDFASTGGDSCGSDFATTGAGFASRGGRGLRFRIWFGRGGLVGVRLWDGGGGFWLQGGALASV